MCSAYVYNDIYKESKTFIGCYIDPSDKHRTRSAEGPEPEWNHTLTWYVYSNDVWYPRCTCNLLPIAMFLLVLFISKLKLSMRILKNLVLLVAHAFHCMPYSMNVAQRNGFRLLIAMVNLLVSCY